MPHRRLVIFAGAVLLSSACLWGILWLAMSHNLEKALVERLLSQSLGVSVSADQVALDWRGRVQLDKLRLATTGGRQLGTVDQAVANVERGSLLRGQFLITNLSLDGLRLVLSQVVCQDLAQLAPPSTLRDYPINLIRSSLEWVPDLNGGTAPGESFRLGPISATCPPQERIDESCYQALVGDNTLLNVTLLGGNANFVTDVQGGNGLPKILAAALTPEDHLHANGRWSGGNLTVDGSLNGHGVEAPLHLEWTGDKPDQVRCHSQAVSVSGYSVGTADITLLLSTPDRLGFELRVKPHSEGTPAPLGAKVAWNIRGWADRDGSFQADGQAQGDLSLRLLTGNLEGRALVRKNAGGSPTKIEASIELTEGRGGPGLSPVPELGISVNLEGGVEGIGGDCHLAGKGGKLAAGKVEWTPAAGFNLSILSSQLKPELLAGFPLRGVVQVAAAWQKGNSPQIQLVSKRLVIGQRELTELQAEIKPMELEGAGSFRLPQAPQPVKFQVAPGKLACQAEQLPLSVIGLGGPLTGQGNLSLEADPEQGLRLVQLSHLQTSCAGKTLPELSTTWKADSPGSPLWNCQVVELNGTKSTPPLAFDCSKWTGSGSWELPPLQLEDLGGRKTATPASSGPTRLGGTLKGSLRFAGRDVELRGTVENFQSPKWNCPQFAVEASLRGGAAKGWEGPWSYAVQGVDSHFSLPGVTGLQGEGQLKVLTSSELADPKVEIDIPKLEMAGRSLGPFLARATLKADDKSGSGSRLQLSLPRLGTSISGSFGASTQEFDLNGAMQKLDLSLLPAPPLPGGSGKESNLLLGTMSGKLLMKGNPTNFVAHLKGQTDEVVAQGVKLGGFALTLSYSGATRTAVLDVPHFPLATLSPTLKGNASISYRRGEHQEFKALATDWQWSGRALPNLEAVSSDMEKFTVLVKPEKAQPWQLEGTLSPLNLVGHLENIDLSLLRGAFPDVPEVKGTISGEARLTNKNEALLFSFQGAGSELSHPTSNIGSAKVTLLALIKGGVAGPVNLDVDDMSAKQLGILSRVYPGLEGRLGVHTAGLPPSVKGLLRLDKARFRQENFPTVNAAFDLKGQVVTLKTVDIKCSPPLKITGQFEIQDKKLKVGCDLCGQSVTQLYTLAGATPNPDFQGNLTGPLSIEGTFDNYQIHFKGSISDLIVKSVPVGEGTLEVDSSDTLGGQLTFAKVMDAADFGRMGGIRGLVKVAGARLSGTPQQPKIDPILRGPFGVRFDFRSCWAG